MDIKLMEKRYSSKFNSIILFSIYLFIISFSTFIYLNKNEEFQILTTNNIKFLLPFGIALVSLGLKFKNYFLIKYPVIILVFASAFILAGKFSFLINDKELLTIIRITLFFSLLIFALGFMLEWEIHIDINEYKDIDEYKMKMYYIINNIHNNIVTLEELCLLNDINYFFRKKIARINFSNKFNIFCYFRKLTKKIIVFEKINFLFYFSKKNYYYNLLLLKEYKKYFRDSEIVLKEFRKMTS